MEGEKVQKKSTAKSIISYLPLITVVIIILGLLKEYIYYRNFNLPIKYFTNITEMGLLFSDDLIYIVTAGSSIYIAAFVTNIYTNKFENSESTNATSKTLKTSTNWARLIFLIIISILTILLIVVNIYIRQYTFFLISVGFILIFSFVLYYNLRKNRYSMNIINNLLILISLATLFLSNIGIIILSVEHGKYNGTKIYTTDSTYTSTDSCYFIGKTDKYVFIYNVKNKYTRIIPSESVLKMDLKSK